MRSVREQSARRMEGYFEIGVHNLKTGGNLGTLWRSATLCGAAGIFTIGRRYSRQPTDTHDAALTLPFRQHQRFEDFFQALPSGALLVGIEQGGEPLSAFTHPPRAVYLLGSEDNGLSSRILDKCHRVVSIESKAEFSYNVATAGSIVMHHRVFLSPPRKL